MAQIIEAPHYVRQPFFIFWIRIALLFLTVLVLALTAFSMSTLKATTDAFAFTIFCCIYSFISIAYLIVTPVRFINLWNCWAALALDIVACIFWLAAWALMASWAAAYAILFRPIKVGNTDFSGLSSLGSFRRSTKSSGLDFGFGDALTDINKSMKKEKSAWQAASAVAGLGALIWIGYLVCLVFYSIALYRHRRAPENAGIPQDGSPVRDEEKTHEMNDVPMYGAEQPTQYMA